MVFEQAVAQFLAQFVGGLNEAGIAAPGGWVQEFLLALFG